METTELFNGLFARLEVKMISIGQQNGRSSGCYLCWLQALNRAPGGHRHEERRFNRAAAGVENSTSAAAPETVYLLKTLILP